MNGPLVSVIIPTFNYSKYIANAIDSVLNQTYRNLEIVVIDDGSTDDTKSVVAEYGDKVHYHFQENQGLPAARNTGLRLVEGEYIQFLDSDDALGRCSIEIKVRCLSSDQDAAFVCCSNRFFYARPARIRTFLKNFIYGWKLPNQADVAATLCYGNIAPPHAFLVRAQAIKNKNLSFDVSLRACEDYDFWLKLMLHYGEPRIEKGGFVYYRKHHTSMSMDLNNQLYHDFLMVERVYNAIQENRLPASESRCEYLIANIAAAMKVLYYCSAYKDQHMMDSLKKHIIRLLGDLEESCEKYAPKIDIYTSEIRIVALKLNLCGLLFDHSMMTHLTKYTNISHLMSIKYFLKQLKSRRSMPHLVNIMIMDVQYAYLQVTAIRKL